MSAPRMFAELARRFGLWRCNRGHHAPLEWESAKRLPIRNTGGVLELWYVGFGYAFAKWNGWCPRCGLPVEWSDSKPHGVQMRSRNATP